MSTLDDHNGGGDYVLVHKSKAKISRARKLVIGTMMVGAIAAIAGAGTFASFSASTDNKASFSTARMALKNGASCITPAGVTVPGPSATSTAVDSNNQACADLFPDPLTPGTLATKDVIIENVGDVAGDLYLFATSACTVTAHIATYDRGTATNLCDRVVLSIEDVTGAPSCIYPTTGGACAVPGQTSTSTFTSFGTSKQFASKITLAPALALATPKTYRVSAYWIKTVGTTACSLVIPGGAATDEVPAGSPNGDGFVDATGQGCDNPYQNQTANLTFRWQIQG